MVSYTQFGFHWIVCVIFLLVFKEYNCSGAVEVKFISSVCSEDVGVNTSCCKGHGIGNRSSPAKPCSREIFVCLVKGIGENATCLSENHTLSIQKFCNSTWNSTTALRLQFGVPWKGISFRVSLHLGTNNECRPGSPVLIHTSAVALFSKVDRPQPFSVRQKFTPDYLTLNHSKIGYQYSVYCDENFFGSCDKQCVPGNTTNCTIDGTRICKAGIFCETSTADIPTEASSSTYRLTSTLSDREQMGQDDDSGNKAAMYAGIGVGVVLAVALAAVIVYLLFRKKHRVDQKNFKKSGEGEQKRKGHENDVLKEQTVPG